MLTKVATALAIVLASISNRAALAATLCTQETLTVEGTPVTIAYCITGRPHASGSEEIVPVLATYSAPGGALRRSTELRFLADEGVSRVLESLDLTKLALTGTLHLTLAYSQGLVHLEGALLTPGAITVK